MNREEEIYIEADKRYPRRWSGDAENSNNLDVFIEGAEWADEHPSNEMIDKFIGLFYSANEKIRQKMINHEPIPGSKELREFQISYIKEHCND